MSMVFGSALMGLGQGLTKYADDLSEKAKTEAADKRSLDLYRGKKDIDLEFSMGRKKGRPPASSGARRRSSANPGSGTPSVARPENDTQGEARPWEAKLKRLPPAYQAAARTAITSGADADQTIARLYGFLEKAK